MSDPFSQFKLAMPDGAPPPRVAWFAETPLSFVGAWEPLSFRKRAGYAWTDEDAAYEAEFSDAALARYKELGATSIALPFAKGFGLSATKHELEQERDTIQRAQKIGLRTAVYIRVDAVVPETVRADDPQVDTWLMRGMHGKLSSYNRGQTFRRRVCYSHPGAVTYLESQFRYAIETLKTDQLHLDGYAIAASPTATCRCEACVASYRQWLANRYPTAEAREQAFGLVDFDTIVPPECERDEWFPSNIISPEIRAWLRFHWDRELAFTRHVRRFVHKLNPDVAITTNPWSLGIYPQMNGPFRHFSRALSILPWMDGVWSEDHLFLRFEKGKVVSRTATLKAVRETDTPLCSYHWTDRPGQMSASIAQNLAANGGNASCLGFTLRFLPHVELCAATKQHLTGWAAERWSLLSHTRPWGEMGLLRHHETLAWNAGKPWEALATFQTLLADQRIGWRFFDGVNHPGLAEVRTLIAADVECLSDEELARLRQWVEAGGRLLVTRRTGRCDLDRRCRRVHPIQSWVRAWQSRADSGPADWFHWVSDDAAPWMAEQTDADAAKPEIAALGQGAIGWWPGNLPKEPTDALLAFVRQLHGPFAVQVEGPPQVTAEFNLTRDGRRLVHLIRVDDSDQAVNAVVRLASPVPSNAFRVLSPDAAPPRVAVDGHSLIVTGLDRYAVLCLEKNSC